MTKCYICDRKPHKMCNLSFHRFPADEEMKQKWLELIGKNDPLPIKRSAVCSLHFTEDCFRYGLVYGTRRLKENAIPSLYLEETLEETEMLNQLHRSSVHQTLDEIINNCHQSENSEEATGAERNSVRVVYKKRRKLKNIDSSRSKESELPVKRIKLNLTWEKITSAPGGGKRYWESAQKELSKRKAKIARLQLALKQARMKLRTVETTIKELKELQNPVVTIYVQDESSADMLVST